MKKVCIVLSIILFNFLMSCSNNGNDLVGRYSNGDDYVYIEKAGDNKFLITSNIGEGSYSSFAEYKEGCFFADTRKGKKEIFCKSDEGLVSYNGIKLTRKK
ncbi:hypothetical protein [Myroides odoratimimus]|uniref:hypothetical protein n=1 Tax=Myroides odoratimimus TaxID=76832 RepID=UPI002576A84E|nr:hypothetical protein [Myroides odoratimimus]MDM1499100.1 hypothetical protein [Myroides odoratimimus]